MPHARSAWIASIIIAVLCAGCVMRPRQDRFLRIQGLTCVSTELQRPVSWQKNKDAVWTQGRLREFGADSVRFLAAVEWEEPFRPDAYIAVWIAGSPDNGLLIVTREYQADRLLHWLQGEGRELGSVPALENLSLPLPAADLHLLEDSLRQLSVQRCTDTVRFFPEQQRTYHVQVKLGGKENEFAVFAPALRDYQRAADRGIPRLAEYQRLSRREADVVATILDFADQKLMNYLKVGPPRDVPAEPLTGGGFSKPD